MLAIPEGEVLMGSQEAFFVNVAEMPQHRVYLDAYWIDRTEVTYAMFNRFVNRIGYAREHSYTGEADLPVVNVTWQDAMAYCTWAEGKLPSEAQ